ncbi:putative Acid phosphatase [Helianthus annuus]|uniref:Purple acid phosphatase n=1 Tax=Helianthus annuus TaxID=4232 RepID=A0A251SI94_HELAN|nr:purple acid phosphatase 22 [Helianthus annuus]KAF5767765.1 putative Acid phosphatase [Helianthus annuus]KAJ0463229.1 putative Acid phosphatase [Helianthus annuus]KAJ0467132.1 putative Acid phosphatase [Helianthus annuus]KAJ0484607.1 putative Acid phosphatase [Helianthus annuus]KAJ0655159.1 putative Acid phosphatase [Helianthus annuus]
MPRSLLLLLLLAVVFLPTHHASVDFTRQPPRPLVYTYHDGPESHPQQVHVSLVGKQYMKISWVTEERNVASIVNYGKIPGKYDSSATGNSTSYHYFLYTSGEIHHVTIGPLDPATIYYYRCGGSGPEFNFQTPPVNFSIEFVVVGDLGQTEWTSSTLEHINASNYDVLLLPGDLSYADTQQPLWDSFGRLVQPYASRRPWMVTQGNHEQEIFPIIYPKGFKAYNARWPMPYEESGSNSNLYYSFDVVGTHIIMLGSYTDFSVDSDQYKWLMNDLAKVDRSLTPWLIVLLHAPWYNSNMAHQGEGESMRLAMEKMLYDSGVDMVFAGHVHAYERFTRVYANNAAPCGPIYITIGDGGNREGLAMAYKEPSPSISLFREASFGHGRLRIINETHAHWSWHRNDDSASVVADGVWIECLSSLPSCGQIKGKVPKHDEL